MAANSSNIKDCLATNSNKLINLTSGIELRPRKAESMCTFIQKRDYHESLHITMKPVIISMETSLTALIFNSQKPLFDQN